MDEKRPKRRKDKYNPYTLTKIKDKHILSFRDGQGVLQEITIDRELFELLDRFELDDLSYLNEVDRHYEHSELTEISLYNRATALPESVEDAVLRNLQYEALYNAIWKLPEAQRRRLIFYYFGGLTYAQIADMEGCKYQTVQESIYAALKNLKSFLK
ncbi:MAG: sigma-70 family RNA polymerase sigma factor [Acutalibacteraceae bacterium]|nr:sigma-70 family RNA polymerase sigma factor [Agathobacter rectalis]MEE0733890.1 sigma-70 family RNA polymerase sigma factor [Acutalibacteraceae bacterium]